MKIPRERRHARTRAVLLAAGALFASLQPGAAHAGRPVERHDWVVGLAYGVGSATSEGGDESASTDWTRGASPQYRVGHMLGRHASIGIEDRHWLDEGGLREHKIRGSVQNISLVLTLYPGRTTDMTSGFFLQVGGGYAHGRVSALERHEGGMNEWGETYEVVATHDAGGWGAVVGGGYEFRISTHFAAGVATSYNIVEFDDDPIFERIEFIPGGLNLNWYF